MSVDSSTLHGTYGIHTYPDYISHHFRGKTGKISDSMLGAFLGICVRFQEGQSLLSPGKFLARRPSRPPHLARNQVIVPEMYAGLAEERLVLMEDVGFSPCFRDPIETNVCLI